MAENWQVFFVGPWATQLARVAAISHADKQAKLAEGRALARRGRRLAERGRAVADDPNRIDPTLLSVEQAAKLLFTVAGQRVAQEKIGSSSCAKTPRCRGDEEHERAGTEALAE